jgi:hypothetical protein
MIKTHDVIDAVLDSKGVSYPFKDVEAIFRSGLAGKLDACLDCIGCRTYSLSYLNWEIRVSSLAGRTLIMLIAPDKDWISFLTARGRDGCRSGFQGVHFENAPQSKFYEFGLMLSAIDDFTEMAVEEPTMRVG